jgi:uncharacterized membrane protein YkvA (DUF1232 family)
MTAVSKIIETFKGWADSFRQDIEALKAIVESNKADAESRRLAAAALSYLVTKLDLIPDHNEGIGIMDDIMVVRVLMQMATQAHELGDLPSSAEVAIGRMTNEAERVNQLLGAPLYDKLKLYCAKLADTKVRGRSPQNIVDDANIRKELYAEIEDELKRSVPVAVSDPAEAELRLKSYLQHKLG